MNIIEMCFYYGYDLLTGRPTCDKGHKANLKCHSMRKDCPDYVPSTTEKEKHRQEQDYIKFSGGVE